MADDYSKCQESFCDVGGRKCRCCNRWRGKHRSGLNRLARRKLKRLTEKDLKND